MPDIKSIREIKKSGTSFRFLIAVFLKSLKIIFRSNKKITMIHASFSNKQVNRATLIKFRFRNALWYEFEKVNTDRREFTIPKINFVERRVLIVHGLFTSRKYILTFDDTNHADNRIKFCQPAENFQIHEEQTAFASGIFVRN